MTGRKDPTHQAFETLIRYLYFLYADWYVLTELFGRSRERVELLNRRAGAVFFFIQDAMQDRLFLGIAKLFDEDSRTLSLRNCIADLPDAPARSAKAVRKEYHERRKRFLDRYEALKKLCEPTLHHRDRRIAHSEQAIYLGKEVLPKVQKVDVKKAMKGIEQLVSDISVARGGEPRGFLGPEMDLGGSCDVFFKVLESGNDALDMRATARKELLDRVGRGDVVENLSEKLKDLRL